MSSTVIAKNIQIGTSGTATNNFNWYQPASPDGTVRLGVGNYGATTLDAITVANTGNVTLAGVATLPAGSVSGPSLTTVGDTNTGVFFPAADTVALSTNGTERVRVISTGQVGIGTSSPDRQLAISAPSPSCEQTWVMTDGKANARIWNLVVDGGNSTTANNLTLRQLTDGGTGVNLGMTINGTTGVLSTLVSRGISAASVPSGSVIQVVYNNVATNYTGSSASGVDFPAWSFTFTPQYATSKVFIMISVGVNYICDGQTYLKRNGTIVKDFWFGSSRQDDQYDYPQAAAFYLDSPGTTSTVTYQVGGRAGGCSNIIRFGGSDNNASFTMMEIAA